MDTTIVRAEIHPAIGMARVGNSPQEFYLGPETPHPAPQPAEFYRDAQGRLKREAARFRIYGFNRDGEVVGELTSERADIEWTVHVANKKAAWYTFTLALDIPEASDPRVEPSRRRNSNLHGEERRQLVIDPGPRSIRGANITTGPAFDSGQFLGQAVYLGELQTDAAGRLLFLPGRGVSRSAFGLPPTDFANNDGWYDDIADGPVRARVRLDGQEIPVEPAWVIVGPPNYAPQLKSVRTLYDLLLYRMTPPGPGYPGPVSFQRHILPIFERLSALQWVNAGFAETFGWRGPYDFTRPELLARLAASPDPATDRVLFDQLEETRRQIYHHFRNYSGNNGWRGLWPQVYGDAMDVDGSPRLDLALSPLQLARLEQWSRGAFQADYDPGARRPASLDEVDLPLQPGVLTEAALTFAVADAFHPGCEVTWAIRAPLIFRDLRRLRLRERPAAMPEPDYGDVLSPAVAMSSTGPLSALGAGDLTRWMALPWQTDSASCRSGYERFTPFTPTFWPARVPNQVLLDDDYRIVMDGNASPEDRMAAFRRRVDWFRSLGRRPSQYLPAMVARFGEMGVVAARPGPGGGEFPENILVETISGGAESGHPPAPTAALERTAVSAPTATQQPDDPEFIPKIHRFQQPLLRG